MRRQRVGHDVGRAAIPPRRVGKAIQWVFGGEASYMWGGNVNLIDEVEGDVGELFIGGFFGFRW